MAARIHDASNFPLEVLKAVPYEGWCIEVKKRLKYLMLKC